MNEVLSRNWTKLVIFCVLVSALFGTTQDLRKASVHSLESPSAPQHSKAGYVLKANEGEVLQRGKGNTVTIKVDPKTGSPGMAMGTQVLAPSVGIPVHMHEHEDEVLFVNNGSGIAVLGEQRKTIETGDTIFVPHGVWHGVETAGTGISLLWVVTPPGLEEFFREISSPLGGPPKTLTPAQIEDVGRKHGLRFKPR